MSAPRTFTALREALASERSALVDHPIYARISTLDDVRVFMEHHVFAVWDFMSLLKSLQRQFTCIDVPWVPRGDPVARRLVNEIVVAEESDDAVNGGYASHFELYLDAMKQCGADTSRVDDFVRRLATGVSVDDALTGGRDALNARRAPWDAIEHARSAGIAEPTAFGRA